MNIKQKLFTKVIKNAKQQGLSRVEYNQRGGDEK
jgi:hypothetical protein